MFHFKKIPKKIHFFWEGKLSFLRYCSMLSFIKFNPEWKIKVHTSNNGLLSKTWQTHEQKGFNFDYDYFDKLSDFSNLEIINHDFAKFGIDNNIHPVHKSDLLRWHLLSSEGGIWSDNDILYLKSINYLVENKIENNNVDTVLCKYNNTNTQAIGFLMSGENNNFFKTIHKESLKKFTSKHYEVVGSPLIGEIIKNNQIIDLLYLNQNFLYQINWYETDKLINESLNLDFFNESIGCHWFGGASNINAFENYINKDNYKDNKSVLSKMIELVLK